MATRRGRFIKDAAFIKTIALPASAGTVNTADIDMGLLSTYTERVEASGVVVTIPALTTTQAPDASTLTVTLFAGPSATPTTQISEAKVLTGAGAAGIGKTELEFRIPPDCPRYLRARAVSASSPGDQSAASMELAITY